ncbi:MAG: hypothetical protein AAFX78_15285 [Cyanobacteria bacterium J06638_20]
MLQSIDDIFRQARQGSVSAIIQILNEKLSDSGVRTRAVLDNGVLQLLCESPDPQQLDQRMLVQRVKSLLEGISPNKIRRVNINGRIAREQQLLWLDEIKRDPDGQLLWSEEVRLKPPNPVRRWFEDRKFDREEAAIAALHKKDDPKKKTASHHFWRGLLVGGLSLGVFALLLGWAVSDWLGIQPPAWLARGPQAEEDVNSATETAPEPAATPAAEPDPFVEAVRIAEQAAVGGTTAETSADWLELASRWQRAADLMSQVPEEDPRYATAQDRTVSYSQNSEVATQEATLLRESAEP